MGLFIKRRVGRVSANCFSQCRHDERGGDGPLRPWLALEDDLPSHPKTGKKTLNKKKSLVVALPTSRMKEESEKEMVGDSYHAKPQTMPSNGDSYQNTFNQYNNSGRGRTSSREEELVVCLPTSRMKEKSETEMVGDSYHAEPQTMPSNGDSYQNTFNQYNNSGRGRASSREEELVMSLPTSARNAGMMKEEGTGLFTRRRVGRVSAGQFPECRYDERGDER